MIIWKPTKKQSLALQCPAFELFYGGAAGGGKTDFLLMDFLGGCNKHRENWRGILFRRTYKELEDIIIRAKELYIPMGAVYKKTDNVFNFPTGSFLRLRYLERDDDVSNYQGHQYTWIGFDELGNYSSDYCWRYMMSRCRSAKGIPCYMRGTGNPGGVGHGWLKKRFIDNQNPNTIYTDNDGNTRCFIPSRLDDNDYLIKNDKSYEKRLRLLPKYLYEALRKGNWDIIAGSAFEEFSRESHVIKPIALDPGVWFKFCSMDWGYSRPFSIGWWAVSRDGRMIRYRELYGCEKGEANKGVRRSAGSIAKEAYALSIAEGVNTMVADPAVWGKVDDGPSIADKFEAEGWKMVKADNDRLNGKMQFHQLLKSKGEDGKPMLLVFDTCFDFIRTIPLLLPSTTRPEDIDTTLEDHIYDETRYAIMSEYARHPGRALEKQNGQWNFRNKRTRGTSFDPYG
ncbi:terminase [Treponema sp. OMZ 792]|uniref:terminase n=1 Tax=unclassified Treponema TaxID=2638727 RepID=UPI0020A42D33|nr:MULTISPECIES: terminase [unclassified Treponema]UTC74136.1 terminase [Treponema sp. OMZ 792]UTC80535.1 terminase [Treponema sp. OMZ 798]